VVRVWQLPPESLRTGGLALLPLAPISAVTEAEPPGIIERIGRCLRGRGQEQQAEVILAAAYILLGLRYSPAQAADWFRRVVSMKESATYQAILEEGRTAGAVAEARKLLRVSGDRAFGPPDRSTARIIDRIGDLACLEELFNRLPTAHSSQELLGQPSPSRRGGRRQGP
jgi:hypothetical protein